MAIPFTQYILPDGRKKAILIDMPDDIERMATELIDDGCHFDAEVLMTGVVSFTCERDDDMLSIVLSENGPQVVEKVSKLVNDAHSLYFKEYQKMTLDEENEGHPGHPYEYGDS